MRTGIDVFHNGVFLLGVEVGRTEYGSPYICLAVTALGVEYLRHGVTGLKQGSDIGFLKLEDDLAIGGTAYYAPVGLVGA